MTLLAIILYLYYLFLIKLALCNIFFIYQIKDTFLDLKPESFGIIFFVFVACPFGISDKFKNERMFTVIIVGNCVF